MFDLTDKGYAVASLDVRSSGRTAREQLSDCKGALRWLQARAARYGYDAARIEVIGGSGGAKLAVMLGVTKSSRTAKMTEVNATAAPCDICQVTEVASIAPRSLGKENEM